MSKVILIGIDAATWVIIDPLIAQGFLPNFKRIKEGGYSSVLLSTDPPFSPPGWTSMFTGFLPLKHRIFDFVKRKRNSYFVEPVFSSDKKKPYLWDYLAKHNKRTVAINIPFSYPPTKLNGILTSGLGAPSKDSSFTYPKRLKSYIIKNFPKFDIDFEENNISVADDPKYLKDKVYEVTSEQFRLTKDLFKRETWDFFAVVFRSIDVIQHFFMREKTTIQKYYSQIDTYIGWFLEKIDKETYLIVCSDHGACPISTRFFINTWLINNNFLKMKDRKKKMKLINLDKVESILLKSPLKKMVWILKRNLFMEFFFNIFRFVSYSSQFGDYENVDWQKTRMYCLPTSTGLASLNQEGREPSGIVSYTQRYEVLSDFKQKILVLKHNGKKVVKKAIIVDDMYPYRSKDDTETPDVILVLEYGFTLDTSFSSSEVFLPETKRYGDHTPEGIFSLYKKGMVGKKNEKKTSYGICDIAPTVLNLLQVETKEKFDGNAIFKI